MRSVVIDSEVTIRVLLPTPNKMEAPNICMEMRGRNQIQSMLMNVMNIPMANVIYTKQTSDISSTDMEVSA